MYVPADFAVTDREFQLDLLQQLPFGLLTTVTQGRIDTSAIPFLLDRNAAALFGHLARANPQWRSLTQASDLTVTLVGPNTYISPSWYSTANRVPTWNYVTVVVRGRVELLDDPVQRLELVDRLSAHHERDLPHPWTSDKLALQTRDALLNAIVAFRIDIDSIEAKVKLSQNRTQEEVRAAAAQLIARDGSSAEREIARMMLAHSG